MAAQFAKIRRQEQEAVHHGVSPQIEGIELQCAARKLHQRDAASPPDALRLTLALGLLEPVGQGRMHTKVAEHERSHLRGHTAIHNKSNSILDAYPHSRQSTVGFLQGG